MIIKNGSILSRTNQAWKHKTSLAFGMVAVFVFVGALYFFPYQSWQFELSLAVAVMFSIVSILINLIIKCPKCGSRWYWKALKTSVGNNGFGKFRSQKECPTCGFSGDVGT